MTDVSKAAPTEHDEPSVPSDPIGLGKRTLFLRKQKGMSLDELATASGLTKGYLSKVERGLSVPSISTALRLARCFGLSVGQLLGDEEIDDSITVVKKSERKPFMRNGSKAGSNYESMAGHKALRAMEPFIMKPPREFQDDRRFQHVGEEFMFVLEGAVEIEFPARRIRLDEGDSIYFDSHIQHRTRCVAGQAQVLVVVYSPPENSQ